MVENNNKVILERVQKKLDEINENNPIAIILKTVETILREVIEIKKELIK